MSRKQRLPNPPAMAPSSPVSIAPSPARGLLLAWLTALIAARWLIPTEGAFEGLTLWLVQLVLLTAVVRMAWVWRFGERPLRFDALDGAMALLIVAQVASALKVVGSVGNSRAALNLAWEWVGSGVLIWLLRQELRTTRAVKSLCLGLSLAAAVLAGYGLWQHYVSYDQMSRDYKRLTTEHDRLSETLEDGRRLQLLRVEMAQQGIPIEPDARRLLEQRLNASREPFGLFALANTFAGLLAVMLLIAGGTLRVPAARSLHFEWIASAITAIVIAFCLVLTKSRTAWVGVGAGIGWWTLRAIAARWRRDSTSAQPRSSFVVWIVVGAVVLGIAVTVAVASGGLDKAVLSEAPKSFRYRLEYWQGTWATICEHFWMGTGPGNFRDHYLAHKLPESSEEIADPHNFVLDVWANAGTFGLVGLLACVGLMLSPMRERGLIAADPRWRFGLDWSSTAVWGVGLAFPLAAVGMELAGHGMDERLWWLGGIWWALWLIGAVCLRQRYQSFKPDAPAKLASDEASLALQASMRLSVALEAANVALLVHLLGAGGIAMPAITQLLWLVWSLRVVLSESSAASRTEKSPSDSAATGVVAGRLAAGTCAVTAAIFCLGCWWTATLPELWCRTWTQLGDAEWEHQRAGAAQTHYLEAAAADRWAIEPLERLAEIAYQRWQQSQLDADFDETTRRLQTVIDRLPFAFRPHRRLGQVWQARFERSHDRQHAQAAAAAFAAAVERYPHHAELLSEWATACDGAGLIQEARDTAERAIRQDDLNRQAGHSDKFLSERTRSRMEQLAADDRRTSDAN